VKVISGGEGKCEAEFTVEKEHTNFMGYLHGGFSASIVDMVSSMALLTHPKHNAGVSVNLSVSYLKGAQIGEEILVKAHTDRVAKKLAFLSVQIINKETGDLIALGNLLPVTYHNIFILDSMVPFFSRLSHKISPMNDFMQVYRRHCLS